MWVRQTVALVDPLNLCVHCLFCTSLGEIKLHELQTVISRKDAKEQSRESD